MILRHFEQRRGFNAADEVCGARLSIPHLHQSLVPRDPSTPLRIVQDDCHE
jgi:hypothetical protein